MQKGKFERTRPHINIGTIGHIGSGRSTLTAALAAVLARQLQHNGAHEHLFEARVDGVRRCVVCTGADVSLPTDCPGIAMDAKSRTAITDGLLDFKAGAWSTNERSPPFKS